MEARLFYLDRFFRGRRAVSIGPALVTAYVAARQADVRRFKAPPANRTINIGLALLKRMLRTPDLDALDTPRVTPQNS